MFAQCIFDRTIVISKEGFELKIEIFQNALHFVAVLKILFT